jgi:hypothetical protein
MTSMAVRASIVIVLGIAAGIGIASTAFGVRSWTLEDMHVYLDAAERLRSGEILYSTTNPLAAYQYAPWFAAAWVPLSVLPRELVAVGWTLVLLGACVVCVWPLIRHNTPAAWALTLVVLPILVFSSARSGNVQPLLVAGLAIGLERRWGPIAIAAAASLKAFPIAMALVYIGRRQWLRAAGAIGLTLLLVAPMLAFDLAAYTADGPRDGTLYAASPLLWAVPVVILAGLTVRLASRRSPHAWLAAAATTVLGMPRLLSYDMTFLLAGLARHPDDRPADGDHPG